MASRWREWDVGFKDDLLPTDQSVLSKETYPEFKKMDQSNVPLVSIPGSLLAMLKLETKNRIKKDVILISDSVNGNEYSYTRDGELKLNTQVGTDMLLLLLLFVC